MADIEVLDIDTDDMPRLRCPRCDSQRSFDVDTTFTVRAVRFEGDDKNKWEPQDCYMSDNDHTVCLACGATGPLSSFKQE